MKKTKLLFNVMIIVSLTLFTGFKPKQKVKFTPGTYGVCVFAGADENSNKVELTLNDDHSFRYINMSNPSKPINIKGTWILKGNTILLKDYTSPFSINNKWKIDKTEKCLKSRKGMLFTRLCNLSECK